MNKKSKIYVAGHTGLVGSALWKALLSKGYTNLVGRTIDELDLMDPYAVNGFFEKEKPEYVILAAAKVGGIIANSTYRGQFIFENLMIQNNVIHNAYLHSVKKLLFLGSTCIYPRDAPQPMPEDCLLTSPLEYTNEPYAIAKIAGIKMCESYNLQYGTNFISVMPTNLYGPNDNFNLETSHVLPALIRKIYLGKCLEEGNWDAIRKDLNKRPIEGRNGEWAQTREGEIAKGREGEIAKGREGEIAKGQNCEEANRREGDNGEGRNGEMAKWQTGEEDILMLLDKYGIRITPSPYRPIAPSQKVSVEIWGSGVPMREFLWSEEMADACIYLMEHIDFKDLIRENSSSIREIRNTHINIGSGKEISIRDLAYLIKEKVGFGGGIIFNASKPDGTMRKLTDPSKIHALGWHHKIEIEEGIEKLYNWYLKC